MFFIPIHFWQMAKWTYYLQNMRCMKRMKYVEKLVQVSWYPYGISHGEIMMMMKFKQKLIWLDNFIFYTQTESFSLLFHLYAFASKPLQILFSCQMNSIALISLNFWQKTLIICTWYLFLYLKDWLSVNCSLKVLIDGIVVILYLYHCAILWSKLSWYCMRVYFKMILTRIYLGSSFAWTSIKAKHQIQHFHWSHIT